jgi:lysophospholipase L1-like esterase
MKILAGSKLVMIGDSITDCGRAKPVGEGLFEAYGNGYVNLVNGMLTAFYPAERIRVVNMGTSGNTVRDLKNRWQTDVIDLKPDWLSIMIGINDVWRQFDAPLQVEWQVPIDEYERTLDELVNRTQPLLKGLVMMTPYFIESNRSDPMRVTMDRYGAVVKKVAAKYGTIFVDTRAAFDRALETLHPMSLAWDRVHPSAPGHFILAKAFLSAVDFTW